MLVPLVLVLALNAPEQNDAAKLFHQMEMKLTSAKTLDCAFDGKIQSEKEKGNVKGELMLGEGNKNCFELTGEFSGKTTKTSTVSNGVDIAIIEEGKAPQTTGTNKAHNEMVRTALARAGLLLPLHLAAHAEEKNKEFNANDEFKVSDFKLGAKEKIGNSEAQIISYTLKIKQLEKPITAQVWVDTKTDLPLKRALTGMKDNKQFTVIETYTKLDLNNKVENKKFELPK